MVIFNTIVVFYYKSTTESMRIVDITYNMDTYGLVYLWRIFMTQNHWCYERV